jgi:hypothetical protein
MLLNLCHLAQLPWPSLPIATFVAHVGLRIISSNKSSTCRQTGACLGKRCSQHLREQLYQELEPI